MVDPNALNSTSAAGLIPPSTPPSSSHPRGCRGWHLFKGVFSSQAWGKMLGALSPPPLLLPPLPPAQPVPRNHTASQGLWRGYRRHGRVPAPCSASWGGNLREAPRERQVLPAELLLSAQQGLASPSSPGHTQWGRCVAGTPVIVLCRMISVTHYRWADGEPGSRKLLSNLGNHVGFKIKMDSCGWPGLEHDTGKGQRPCP